MKFLSEAAKANFTKKVQESRGKLPPLEEILKLISRGMTQGQIAEKYGVTRQSVSKALNKRSSSYNSF